LGTPSFGTVADRLDAIYSKHPILATQQVGDFIKCAGSDSGDCLAVISWALKGMH
jgi:hypothetical protein